MTNILYFLINLYSNVSPIMTEIPSDQDSETASNWILAFMIMFLMCLNPYTMILLIMYLFYSVITLL